ncbi:MAG: type II toxin-antitoxin system VapC family toxin [Thermodesulfobacteriota bacterium]
MRQVLLDTNAYVAFKRGMPEAVSIVQMADRIGLASVVLGELLAGFLGGRQEAVNRSELAEFVASSRVLCLQVGERTAEYYAAVFHSLRRKGRPIPTNDLWIAATALEHGFKLFSFDSHFSAIDGLLVACHPEGFLP